MASGDTLLYFTAQHGVPPATAYAQQDVIAGTSTPAENIPVLAFDASAREYIDFRGKMPQHYDGGGVTLVLCTGAGATAGGIRWEAAFRSFEDDAEDLDTTAHTYDTNGVSVTSLPSAIGEVTYDNITFTDGADMDSAGAGDEFILRIYRDHDHADDTAAADGYLHGVEIKES
jgi:hypothetical protein